MSARDPDAAFAANRYYDRAFGSEAVKLLPGECFVTHEDVVLVTVLGSCVAACVRDRESGIGGMNHFMLPGPLEAGDGPVSVSARYGSHAMEMLINALLKTGARRANLVAKVFGGGAVLDALTVANVGDRNADFVLDYLQRDRIPLAAQDLRGRHARKVYFFPRSGRVMVRELKRVHTGTLLQRETEYARNLLRQPVGGDVELF